MIVRFNSALEGAEMNQAKLLQEIQKMRFEEAREGIPCEQLERAA